MSNEKNFETDAIRHQHERTSFREHSVPLYLTSSFVFDDAEQARAMFADEIQGNIYSRYSNPNTNELVEKLCLMEGTEDGIATASGMAAMYCSMAALLKSLAVRGSACITGGSKRGQKNSACRSC